MCKPRLAMLAFWIVAAAGGVALAEQRPASQTAATHAASALPSRTPALPPDASVHRQMFSLEYHARVNMVLYRGRFGGPDLANVVPHLADALVPRRRVRHGATFGDAVTERLLDEHVSRTLPAVAVSLKTGGR